MALVYLINYKLIDSQFWMEYEGIGCPELYFIFRSLDNLECSRIYKSLKPQFEDITYLGLTRSKLLGLVSDERNTSYESDATNNIYIVFRDSLLTFLELIKANLTTFIKVNGLSLSEEKPFYLTQFTFDDFAEIIKHDVSIGCLSYVIEYLILEIELHKVSSSTSLLVETKLIETFIRLLIDAQEYDALKAFMPYLKGSKVTTYGKYLLDYTITITTRNPIQAHAMLRKIIEFKKYSSESGNDWYEFLILNQAAFCCFLLGKEEQALTYESQIMSVADQDFHSYISCINISRLLIKRKLPREAVVSLLACAKCIENIQHDSGYFRIILAYLSQCIPELSLPINYSLVDIQRKAQPTCYGYNWRVAQAFRSFSNFSNYARPDSPLTLSNQNLTNQPKNNKLNDHNYRLSVCLNKSNDYLIPYLSKIKLITGSEYTFRLKNFTLTLDLVGSTNDLV